MLPAFSVFGHVLVDFQCFTEILDAAQGIEEAVLAC